MTNKSVKYITCVLAVVFIAVNLMAYMQARAMLVFTATDSRTASPEQLTSIAKLKVLLTGVNIPRPENSETPADFGVAFEKHHTTNLQNHTLEMWYVPGINEEVLILLFHGYASSKDSLLPVAKQLNAMGWGTMLVDFYGSGGSTGDRTTIGFLESADVTQSYKYAREMWPDSNVILYGQSMGGASVLRSMAVDNIKPEGLIVEATYDKMLSTVKNRFSVMGIPSVPLAHLLVFWGGWQSDFNAFRHNPSDYAKAINSPALVLHGERDPRVTTSQAKAVFEELRGWKHYSSYPTAGHEAVLNVDLLQWHEDVNRLIEQAKN